MTGPIKDLSAKTIAEAIVELCVELFHTSHYKMFTILCDVWVKSPVTSERDFSFGGGGTTKFVTICAGIEPHSSADGAKREISYRSGYWQKSWKASARISRGRCGLYVSCNNQAEFVEKATKSVDWPMDNKEKDIRQSSGPISTWKLVQEQERIGLHRFQTEEN